MSRILFSVMVLLSVPQVRAQSACGDIFTSPINAETGAPSTEAEPGLGEFKKDALPEPVTEMERATAEKTATDVKETFRMTDAELDALVVIARKEFKDDSLMRRDVLHKLYEEKRNFDASIDGQLKWFGASLSRSIREMRKRRQEFQMALLQGDALIAANMYRSLYESFGVSTSLLVSYARGDVNSRDGILTDATSKYLLRGLTADKNFSDIRKIVDNMFDNRFPSVAERLDVLDRIVARTGDEFRYVEWYLRKIENDPETPPSLRENVEYIRGKLSIDHLAEKFRFPLLKDADIRDGKASSALVDARPQILIYWLKRVAQQQRQHSRILRLRSVFHLEALQKFLTRLPAQIRGAVLALARIDYNTYVIDRHIESIEAVLLAEKDVRLQVFTSKVGFGDKNKSAQFLETMARLSSDMEIWNEIKTMVVERSAKNANYKELLDQMEAAEKNIAQLGFLAKLNSPSMHDHFVGWMTPGMIGLGSLAYAKWDVIVQGYTYVLTLVGLQ